MATVMTKEQISRDIRIFILDNYMFGYEESELQGDSSFLELGILDSTGIVELIAFVEGKFKIEVPDDEILPENLDSIDRISNYVCGKMC